MYMYVYVHYMCAMRFVARFDDAGFYYWLLTKSALESARKEAQGEGVCMSGERRHREKVCACLGKGGTGRRCVHVWGKEAQGEGVCMSGAPLNAPHPPVKRGIGGCSQVNYLFVFHYVSKATSRLSASIKRTSISSKSCQKYIMSITMSRGTL